MSTLTLLCFIHAFANNLKLLLLASFPSYIYSTTVLWLAIAYHELVEFMCLTWNQGADSIKKMPSYQYRKSHYGDKTILRPSYLHDGISHTGKVASLYWIRALAPVPLSIFRSNSKIHENSECSSIVVIGRVYFTLECFGFSSNFEFDRNMLSGTGARPLIKRKLCNCW